jgi:GT2 family glycosyltransferase
MPQRNQEKRDTSKGNVLLRTQANEPFLKHSEAATMSIIIVNWNTRDLLLQCLRSIMSQVAQYSGEIIVVDNASEDDSVDAVRREFPNVVLIVNQQNLGFARANNLALRECAGRYVFLINSDVVLRDGCISSLYEYMKLHLEIGILAPKILNTDLSLQESCKEFPTIWNSICRAFALDTAFPGCRLFSSHLMRYWLHNDIRAVDILSGCFWMVRRDALEAVGPLDERFFMYAEDKDWCKRYWHAGWSVVYYPEAEAIHLAAASSARDPLRFYVEMNRANLLYWRKHYGHVERVAMCAILLLHNVLRIIGASATWLLRPRSRQAVLIKVQRSIAVARLLLFDHPA